MPLAFARADRAQSFYCLASPLFQPLWDNGLHPLRSDDTSVQQARPWSHCETRNLYDHRPRHVLGEPAKLLLELLGRDAFRPVDHEMLEPRIFRRDGLDAVDDLLGRAAEPRLLLDAVPQARRPRRRPGRAPGTPMFVGVAHEAEGGEPLVALIMRGLDAADRLFL